MAKRKGKPAQVAVRMDVETVAKVDRWAAVEKRSRANAVWYLLTLALKEVGAK